MGTYVRTVTPASATATTDRLYPFAAVRNDGASNAINTTNLAYAWVSVDASGRLYVVGATASIASGTVTLASGTEYIGQVSAFQTGTWIVTAVSSATTANVTQGTSPWIVSGHVTADQNGVVWGVTASAITGRVTADQNGVIWGVTSSAVTANQGTSPWVVGQGGTIWGVTSSAITGRVTADQNGVVWGVTASAITGRVTADQNGVVWGVTASAITGRVTADQNDVIWGVTSSAVTANQGTSPWVVSQNGIFGVTASAVTANVQGNVAHDAVDSGNPVKVGYKTLNHGADPATAAALDRTDAYANRAGIPWMLGGHPNIQTFEFEISAANTNVTVLTSANNQRIVITEIGVYVGGSTQPNTSIRVGFSTGASGTALAATSTAASALSANQGILIGVSAVPAAGGYVRGNGGGIIAIGGIAQQVSITNTVPTGGRAKVMGSYFVILES